MPKTQELIDIAGQAIRGGGDYAADLVRGSDYESIIGPTAVIYSRQGLRDIDLFNAGKFHTAVGDDLTRRVLEQFGVQRYLDTRGTGTAVLARPTAAGADGTIWAGTRILIYGSQPKYYRTVEDTPVLAGELVVSVAIEAVELGRGSLANETTNLRVDDELWDNTWVPRSLVCADGTNFESATALIARVREGRKDSRVGHLKKMELVCKAAGADKVVIFRSDFGGADTDSGLNVCYVGDAGYTSSAALVKACTLALRSARVLGDHLQVLQMGRANLAVSADIYLRDQPQDLDTVKLDQIHRSAVTQYLGGREGGFTFSRSGMRGALIRHTPEVQGVTIVTPSADVGILTAGAFPEVLYRYIVSDIALRYHGPT